MKKIINYLFVGDYGKTPGCIAHEWMNFVKADDGTRYIWLNDKGIYNYNENADILLVERLSPNHIQVLGKACNCEPVVGSNVNICKNAVTRYNLQRALGITYSGIALADIYDVPNTIVTFKCERFMYPSRDIILSTKLESTKQNEIYVQFTSRRTLREFCQDNFLKNSVFDMVFDDPTLWVDAEPDIISVEGWAKAHAMSPLFSDFERETGRKLLEKIEELRNRN